MTENASAYLGAWSSFYAMTGTAAASLTGLMFVVITLVTRIERRPDAQDGIGTFSTPTVVHFCAALFVSAVLAAPWHTLIYPAVFIGLVGFCGIMYVSRIMYRTRRLSFYIADLEDWIWYAILPWLSYAVVFAGAIFLAKAPSQALFALAAGALFQIFIGIRNAWDVVTYIATGRADQPRPSQEVSDQRPREL